MTVRERIAMLEGMDPLTRSRRHGSSANADVAGMGGGWLCRGLGRMERLGGVAAGRRPRANGHASHGARRIVLGDGQSR
jgi:hypothetical protein